MSYPKLMPRRSPEKQIIIDLGDKVRLQLDSSRSTHRMSALTSVAINRSKIDLRGNQTERRQPKMVNTNRGDSSDSGSAKSVRMHKLTESRKPRMQSQLSQQMKTLIQSRISHHNDHQRTQLKRQSVQRSHLNILQLDSRNVNIQVLPTTRSSTTILSEMIGDLLKSRRQTIDPNVTCVRRLVNRNCRKIAGLKINYQDLRSVETHWDYYEGDTLNNQKDGYGTLTFLSGERFTGKFVKGQPDGQGTFYQQDGSIVIGLWNSGVLKILLA